MSRSRVLTCLAILSLFATTGQLSAAPITSAGFFSGPHTHITFETDGSGGVIPVQSNVTFLANEYASQGLTVNPDVRVVNDSDPFFHVIQSFAGGSNPYGLQASHTSSLEFNPPVTAVGFVFVATCCQGAKITAKDMNGAVIESVTFSGSVNSFLEYGYLGVSSPTILIAKLEISGQFGGPATSGTIDDLRFIPETDADHDGVPDDTDNCPNNANSDQADADNDGIGDVCDNDIDGDGVLNNVDNCPLVSNASQSNIDGDAFGDACDNDIDGDGLSNTDEATRGTNPNVADTDGDGLIDGIEVDIAQGGGCPNPLVADSDGDGLSDGYEVLTSHTSPCNVDSDDDGVNDGTDPLPLQPGVTSGFLESTVRSSSTVILNLNLSNFDAANNNAKKARQSTLSNHAAEAANQISRGNYNAAINQLSALLEKIDDQPNPPDWMLPSAAKTSLANNVRLYITLLGFF